MYLAKRLELTGWVKNLSDGSVLLEAQGSTARLRKLLILLKSQKHLMIAKNVITVIPMRAYERDFRVDSGR